MEKFGVILGFIGGNILLSYIANGNTVSIIYIKEILVASLGLLLVPKSIQINIEDFFGKNLCLPAGYAYNLENNADMVYKLNTVSETIGEMSRNYETENETEVIDKRKEAFIEEMQEKIENMEENVLYEDLRNEENTLLSEIFDILVSKDNISKEDILKLLESHNEYVTRI